MKCPFLINGMYFKTIEIEIMPIIRLDLRVGPMDYTQIEFAGCHFQKEGSPLRPFFIAEVSAIELIRLFEFREGAD